jgi:hypothetical protein
VQVRLDVPPCMFAFNSLVFSVRLKLTNTTTTTTTTFITTSTIRYWSLHLSEIRLVPHIVGTANVSTGASLSLSSFFVFTLTNTTTSYYY